MHAALAEHGSAVLIAPPGAGKSTVVPLALLEAPWARDKRIVMLEPRRLAARTLAHHMAHSLGESVGETVGYRMRLDTRVSRATRIEIVTEGVLTRMLQHDPALEGVGLVIFDEFHERSLQADLGLALALDARDALVPELRLLVMSATLEAEPVARLLGEAPVVSAAGTMFAVECRFVGQSSAPLPGARSSGGERSEHVTARIVRRALSETEGDLLVFLPGAAEIRAVRALLEEDGVAPGVRILPLLGELDLTAQEAALAPAAAGERKVVLATNIAETSLTIEGVRVVVDSGLVRRAVFDPGTGMSRLETQRISRAAAEQRCGRAGRTAPGICLRAWSETAHRALAPATLPEVASADLAPLALELARWGVREAASLRWLDPPPPAMLASARDLLRRLGALDAAGRITAHGQEMTRLALHPRLAHMLLEARRRGSAASRRLACELAALLSDRDLLRGGARPRDPDVRTRLGLLRARSGARTRRLATELERQLSGRREPSGQPSGQRRRHPDGAREVELGPGLLLAFAYPDRIGRRRPGVDPRYTLANGRGATFAAPESLAREEYIVAVELDDSGRDARIRLAAPLARQDIETHFEHALENEERVEWSPREEAVVARRTLRLGALVIEETPLPRPPADATLQAMLTGLRAVGLDALPWTREARDLQARVEFVRRHLPDETADWQAMDDGSLAASMREWLAPWLQGITRREQLARLPLLEALQVLLGPARQRRLDALAPARLEVPSGSRIRIDYRGENAPLVAVRLQELFGLASTPRVAGGRVPVTFELLSPAARPVQVTRDLTSFWRGTYADVRKDLRGRYPKHHWPEDPLSAQPSRGVRPRR